ncbi:hypothetical protein DOZ91_22760 [Peribacillus frigoritolerans]|nr:hypothetical protein DOZ91_22760 [Peribacillus frigoritolerans]
MPAVFLFKQLDFKNPLPFRRLSAYPVIRQETIPNPMLPVFLLIGKRSKKRDPQTPAIIK